MVLNKIIPLRILSNLISVQYKKMHNIYHMHAQCTNSHVHFGVEVGK